ncbi:hypothetical protein GCM10009557_13240 [Virgisporangium ochraceum]
MTVVGLLLLGFLWIFLDGVLRDRRPPVDAEVLALLVAVLQLTLSDRARPLFALVAAVAAGAVVTHFLVRRRRPRFHTWRRLGPWATLLWGLPELVSPAAGLRALWRRTAPLRQNPVTYLAFRRLGYRRPAVTAELSRWFTPTQVGVLAWDVEALTYATAAMSRVRVPPAWDAEAFIRVVRAAGHDVTPHLGNWAELHRLGVDDPAGLLAYVGAPDADLRFALRYAVGRPPVPYGVVLTLSRLGVTKLWAPVARLQEEMRVHGARYPTGWTGLLTWLEHAGTDLLATFREGRQYSTWDAEPHFRAWRAWTPVAERAPHLEAALWAAAGFTVDEALSMLEAGDEPDVEILLGLAALRRTA